MSRIAAAAIDAATQVSTTQMTNDTNKSIAESVNKMNKQINDDTNAANRQLAQQQNQWNIEQWNRENEYNAPAMQVQRLQQAGLSQAAAAQSIDGAGNAGPLQSADLANQQPTTMQPYQQDFTNMIPSVVGLMRELANLKKDEAEANIKEKENEVTSTRLFTENDILKKNSEMLGLEIKKQYESFPYSVAAIKYKALGYKKDLKIKDSLLDLNKANKTLVEENVKLARQNFNFLKDWNPQQIRKIGEEIEKTIAEAERARQDVKTGKAQEDFLHKEGKLVDQQSEEKELSNILTKAGAPTNVAQRTAVMLTSGKLNPQQVSGIFKNLRNYVENGYKTLYVSPFTRDYYDFVVDEGGSASKSLNFSNLGAFDWLGSKLGGLLPDNHPLNPSPKK